jgi:hypothetical protein
MRSDPGAGSPQGLLFHELPTADIEVHHEAQPPEADHPAAGPDPTARAGLREEWWRAWLVGTAAALMAAGVTTGVLLSLGRNPAMMTAADMRPMPASGMPSIAFPAPALAGRLVLAHGASVADSESLPVVLSDAEQFFAAREPGVAAVYRQSRSFDPDTGGPKYVSFVGVDAGLAHPAARLDSYLRSAASGHADVRFGAVAAGPGGTGECVSFAGSAGRESECGWATETTVGVLTAPARDYDASQLASLMRQARPHLEHG